jgi:hypothetical protein
MISLCLRFLRNSIKNIQVSIIYDRNNNTVYEDLLNLTIIIIIVIIIISGSAAQLGLWPRRNKRFLDNTQRHTTVGRTPLDE